MKNTFILLYVLLILACTDEKKKSHSDESTRHMSTADFHDDVYNTLPFNDSTDFIHARRGFIATLDDPVIKNKDGSMAYNLGWFDFLESDAPETVNPSLWRQSQLNAISGLFEVTEGIYQVRGLDLANMTIVETDNGRIIIDPLTTEATARAAMTLVNEHLGKKDIKAVLITHSHIDHFGGIKGLAESKDEYTFEIIAPEGFYANSISENVIGGNAMMRRAAYMFGSLLPKNAEGFVGSGLGQAVSTGHYGILKPTTTIKETGQEIVIDGLRIIFQHTPEAEAPSEFMFYLPKYRAFCQAEEINHTLHNLYTLRGAKVRNGLKWAKYIDETIQLFGEEVEISFGSHHWPTWGREGVQELWVKQRDLYKFIHDETLYLANNGLTMNEIAEQIELPENLSSFFANRGYYGTLSHNAKAQYQLYFGWYDGNPANLNPLPPEESSVRYIQYMGGADTVMARVEKDIRTGNFRWAATVLNHLVFADPTNQEARNLLAKTYEQLAYRAESGPWRNFYLTGAQELKYGIITDNMIGVSSSEDILVNMPLEDFYDYMAVRMDRSKARGKEYVFNMVFPDINESISIYLVNEVLHNRPGVLADNPNATITMNKSTFNDIILKKSTGLKKMLAGDIKISGSRKDYSDFQDMVEKPFDQLFNIVEP